MRPVLLLPALLLGACETTTPEHPDLPTTLRVRVTTTAPDAPSEGTLALVGIDLDGPRVAHDTWRRRSWTELDVDHDAIVDLELPDHPSDLWFSSPGGGWGGLEVAAFVLGTFDDVDDNGAIDPGEPLIGGHSELLAYVRPLADGWPGEWVWLDDADAGFTTGLDGARTVGGGSHQVVLDTNLLEVWHDALQVHAPRDLWGSTVDVYSTAGAEAPTLTHHDLAAGPMAAGVWLAEPATLPARDHVNRVARIGSGAPVADLCEYFVVAYRDANNNRHWDMVDENVLGASYTGPRARIVRYTGVTNLAAAVLPDLTPGWSLVAWNGAPGRTVRWAEGVHLAQ